MSGIHDALLFLVNTFFDLYLFILAIRVLLAFAGASYLDPVTQFIVRCTDIIVKPLREIVPNFKRIEISTVLIIFVLEIIKFFFVSLLTFGSVSIFGIIIVAVADSLKIFLQTYFYAIILQAILSWVQPASPVNALLYRMNAPVMRPIQRLVPPIGGIDISPLPAIILLQLLIILIVNPLMSIGLGVSLG